MSITNSLIFSLICGIGILNIFILFKLFQQRESIIKSLTQNEQIFQQYRSVENMMHQGNLALKDSLAMMQQQLSQTMHEGQLSSLKHTQETLEHTLTGMRRQITETLTLHAEIIAKQIEKLTDKTDNKLQEISGQVDKRLTEGFEKTNETFINIIKRLTIIDEAQKKITELSSNVVSLHSILSDKHSRGTFGEVQLSALIRNTLPENCFALQHSLSNGKRVDCMLFLPEPTGNVAIDAKFPLESYRHLISKEAGEAEKHQYELQFRKDIRKHIQDIAEKYIIPNETADGAVMFIPAEAVFAEIHANYPELVEEAHRSRVWMVSPNTMMAILTTARAVIKDAATRQQIHIIQEHLGYLAKDFERFEKRMSNLAKHIEQAHEDVNEVNTSAKKIASRFHKIESAELGSLGAVPVIASASVSEDEAIQIGV